MAVDELTLGGHDWFVFQGNVVGSSWLFVWFVYVVQRDETTKRKKVRMRMRWW
jgi:hypothetical protein